MSLLKASYIDAKSMLVSVVRANVDSPFAPSISGDRAVTTDTMDEGRVSCECGLLYGEVDEFDQFFGTAILAE